jgi:hypothetical protein
VATVPSAPQREEQEDAPWLLSSAHHAAAPGLQNQTGEYNCFLNVIIQCLWHCRDFRERLLSLPEAQQRGAALLPRIAPAKRGLGSDECPS